MVSALAVPLKTCSCSTACHPLAAISSSKKARLDLVWYVKLRVVYPPPSSLMVTVFGVKWLPSGSRSIIQKRNDMTDIVG
jgi:hypothetical protein